MDQKALETLLQQHGIETEALTPFATFENEMSYRLEVRGTEAIATWQTLRGLAEVTGFWPIILWDYEKWEDVVGRGGKTRPPQDIIDEGLRLDAENWIRQRLGDFSSEYGAVDVHGEWPDEMPPITSMTIGEHFPGVNIALLPTMEGWRAPSYLNFGAWNDCPSPQAHVCVMKHWHERYGAELMGMAGAVVEVWVPRPPQGRESALQLAREQFAYCHEVLGYDLITDTLEDLAVRLLNSSLWHFWWD